MKLYLLVFLFMVAPFRLAMATETLVFDCKRAEKDFTEEYEMKLVVATKLSKAKIYLDGRDLDQVDGNGSQLVKNVHITPPNIVMLIDAHFEPEILAGIAYPAGTVTTLLTLNQVTGKLKKVETIQGGILGSNLGNGTRTSEESCLPAKGR
ncbi:hypothetical protein [Polynucleobacter sp. UB-Tiil-W10]|uniref:hypothetical protein n=1 Tax=Polynucleobacter sp. UB-Tiil-W10 TaxID=1855648 RepID=UPI002105FEAA|nr:hypothetical protein [Polynucleobacter sp. UB-Tiil-W10]